MPVIRRKGLAGVIRDIRNEASGAADQLDRVGKAVSGLTGEAEKLARIQAPGTFAAPGQRSTPGFSPILGADGSAIGGRRTLTRGSGGGGGAAGGGASGGGGGGGQRTSADILRSLTGAAMPGEWVRTYCTPVRIKVPALGGSISIPGSTGSFREVDAWQCPAPWGTFIEDDSILASMSASSSGGGTSAPNLRSKPLIGRGISNSTITPGRNSNGPTDFFTPESSGLQSSGQGFSSSGIESRLDKTNSLLEKAIRGDGGTGLRAGGLL